MIVEGCIFNGFVVAGVDGVKMDHFLLQFLIRWLLSYSTCVFCGYYLWWLNEGADRFAFSWRNLQSELFNKIGGGDSLYKHSYLLNYPQIKDFVNDLLLCGITARWINDLARLAINHVSVRSLVLWADIFYLEGKNLCLQL